MASPTREKRAWPPREKDAESAESAAFEATVAVVKETVVRSGEVLVSAKEDLSDHKRWLELQRAAGQADRLRHERWVERQREKQEAIDKRERAKRRRQLIRQRAFQAVENAIFASVDFVLSLFWLSVGKIAALFTSIGNAILSAFAWLGARLRNFAASVTRLANKAAAAIAGRTRSLAGATGSAFSAAGSSLAAKSGALARSTSSAVAAAGGSLGARSAELARSAGKTLSAAGSSAAAKSAELAPETGGRVSAAANSPTLDAASAEAGGDHLAVATSDHVAVATSGDVAGEAASGLAAGAEIARPGGEALSSRLTPVLARVVGLARPMQEALSPLIASISAKAGPLARSIGEQMSAGVSAVAAKMHVLAPSLHGAAARAGQLAGGFAREGSARAGRLLATIKPHPAPSENELSSPADAISLPAQSAPARIGRFELGQMLIISGVVLLVCGGLLVGSGLMLRAAGTTAEKPLSPQQAVVWFYEEAELPIVERSVFSADLTPHGVRLTGLAIKAENNSDDALTGLEGVAKPDAKPLELKLEVTVESATQGGNGAHEAEAASAPASGVIAPHAFFNLVFLFPPEAHGEAAGIALDDFLAAYGGLMLKLRYDVGGTQKSLIQYLSPAMLKAQLAEIQHEADGS